MIHTVSWSASLLVRDSCSCWIHRLSVSSLDTVNGGYKHKVCIRESVDSLYRDDSGEISPDPRTKRLKTRRESLPWPSKHTSNSLTDFFAEGLHFRRRSSSDRFLLAASHYGRSWSSSMADTEQHNTQYIQFHDRLHIDCCSHDNFCDM